LGSAAKHAPATIATDAHMPTKTKIRFMVIFPALTTADPYKLWLSARFVVRASRLPGSTTTSWAGGTPAPQLSANPAESHNSIIREKQQIAMAQAVPSRSGNCGTACRETA